SYATPDGNFAWIREMLEFQGDLKDPREFIERMRIDLFSDEVYVFTPRGDVKAFPRGATPLDFAYAIHTDVGHHCTGAKANGKQVSLKYVLKNGEIIEITTSNTSKPKREWVKLVKTTRARTKIAVFLREELKERSIALGREILEKELKKKHINSDDVLKTLPVNRISKKLDFSSEENLFAAIGYGKYSVNQLITKIVPKSILDKASGKEGVEGVKEVQSGQGVSQGKGVGGGVKISGIDDVLIRFAKCCSPVPGDQIVGYISVGKGVTVHSADCANVNNLVYDSERRVSVEWDRKTDTFHKVKITVHVDNKPGMLSKVSNAIAEKNVNICEVMTVREKADTVIHFSIDVSNIKQLQSVINAVKLLDEVRSVERIKGVYHPKKGFANKLKKQT
ncbi:MAG: TGS domain-containing protein, partial [Nitrospinota bacterium]